MRSRRTQHSRAKQGMLPPDDRRDEEPPATAAGEGAEEEVPGAAGPGGAGRGALGCLLGAGGVGGRRAPLEPQ